MQIARSIRCGLIALAATFVNVAPASEVAAAPIMKTQAPCAGSLLYCKRITTQTAGTTAHTMRSIVFQPPSAGKAWVQFKGSGFCTNNFGSHGFVIFQTQIIPTSSALPEATGPGGNTFWFTVDEGSAGAPDGIHVFNLSSNRVFPITSTAVQTYYFRLGFSRIDSNIVCNF